MLTKKSLRVAESGGLRAVFLWVSSVSSRIAPQNVSNAKKSFLKYRQFSANYSVMDQRFNLSIFFLPSIMKKLDLQKYFELLALKFKTIFLLNP